MQPKRVMVEKNHRHFRPAVIENSRIPLRLMAPARIRMLIEMCAVEVNEAMLIGRKMSWDPVHNHSDAVLMKMIDQKDKVVRRSEAAGRRKVSSSAFPPGSVSRRSG